jgi:hypothetical protein
MSRFGASCQPNRSIYHTMLNTALGDELVIQVILRLKDRLEHRTALAG